jgi:hypothetical protein
VKKEKGGGGSPNFEAKNGAFPKLNRLKIKGRYQR